MMIFCKIIQIYSVLILAYRKKFSQKINICFATLGVKECEPCLAHKISNHEDECEETCKTCKNWKNQVQTAQLSRQEYIQKTANLSGRQTFQ